MHSSESGPCRQNNKQSSCRLIRTSLLLLIIQTAHSFPTWISARQVPVERNLYSLPPRHVAFICDGNSRWAKEHNLPTAAGHAAGAERLVEVLNELKRAKGISYCTMYAFSTENWARPRVEIDQILKVIETTTQNCYQQILQDRMRVCIIGDMTDKRLPSSLVQLLQQLEKDSHEVSRGETEPSLTLSMAINYGGRQDILNASKQLAILIAKGRVDPNTVTEEDFSRLLSTRNTPEPDLIIRTSGECRLSNFLLWNAAYAELYFTATTWPDFTSNELHTALEWFASRKRRYGSRIQGANVC